MIFPGAMLKELLQVDLCEETQLGSWEANRKKALRNSWIGGCNFVKKEVKKPWISEWNAWGLSLLQEHL